MTRHSHRSHPAQGGPRGSTRAPRPAREINARENAFTVKDGVVCATGPVSLHGAAGGGRQACRPALDATVLVLHVDTDGDPATLLAERALAVVLAVGGRVAHPARMPLAAVDADRRPAAVLALGFLLPVVTDRRPATIPAPGPLPARTSSALLSAIRRRAPDAADLPCTQIDMPPQSRHCVLTGRHSGQAVHGTPCAQVADAHLLHECLRLPCSQMPRPGHSLQKYGRRPCWHMGLRACCCWSWSCGSASAGDRNAVLVVVVPDADNDAITRATSPGDIRDDGGLSCAPSSSADEADRRRLPSCVGMNAEPGAVPICGPLSPSSRLPPAMSSIRAGCGVSTAGVGTTVTAVVTKPYLIRPVPGRLAFYLLVNARGT